MTTEALIEQIKQAWPGCEVGVSPSFINAPLWFAIVSQEDDFSFRWYAPTPEAAAAKAIAAGRKE